MNQKLRSLGVGDKAWVVQELCPGIGSPHKEGDCTLIKVTIDHVYIIGYALNKKKTRWKVLPTYAFRERYPVYADGKSVFPTIKAALADSKKNKKVIVKIFEFTSEPCKFTLDGKKYNLVLKKVLVKRG
jgi:hypothetical protein